MSLHTEWVPYGTDQGYTGYLAKPARAEQPLAAVVVIQEIWGVDGHIQDLVRRFAQAGYVAFAPDLYTRNGQRPAPLAAERIEEVKNFLDSVPPGVWHSQEERQAAIAKLPGDQGQRISETFTTLFGGLEYDRHIEQLLATTAWLRETCPHSQGQPVVSVGFCMGGALSARLACADAALRGAVIFYGQAPETDRLAGIQCPVRGFYGRLDPRITEAVPAFAEAMAAAGKDFKYTVYEGAHHAFFNDTRRSYHPLASRDALAQTLQFFNEQTRA